MKRSVCRFICCTMVTVMALVFCVTIILANPLISHAGPAAPGAQKNTPAIEARIKAFHSKLKITEAQEEQWNKLADVMRENAATMEALIKERKNQGKNLNAVEDLKSYSRIADAHAAGLHKFIPVFETLYDSMSDEQKKNADKIFTKHTLTKLKKK